MQVEEHLAQLRVAQGQVGRGKDQHPALAVEDVCGEGCEQVEKGRAGDHKVQERNMAEGAWTVGQETDRIGPAEQGVEGVDPAAEAFREQRVVEHDHQRDCQGVGQQGQINVPAPGQICELAHDKPAGRAEQAGHAPGQGEEAEVQIAPVGPAYAE